MVKSKEWWPCALCTEWFRCYRQVWHGDERDKHEGSDYDFKFGKKACDRLMKWRAKPST